MIGGAVRSLLFPMRWACTSLPRGSFLRSACVPLLKVAQRQRGLVRGLREIKPIDRPDLTFEAADSWVMDDVYWFGVQGYEGILSDIWVRLCGEAASVLEIGGNVGLYSVIGGKAARGQYTVVEPVPHIASVLAANLARNGLSRVELLRGAAIPDASAHKVGLNIPAEDRLVPSGAHLVTGVDLENRSSREQVEVDGFPMLKLVEGRDLIKMDAEGIEHALLSAVMPRLLESTPTIVVEVLPESRRLCEVLVSLAMEAGYTIQVVPEYGSNKVVTVRPDAFYAEVPGRFNSKDVVLSRRPLS